MGDSLLTWTLPESYLAFATDTVADYCLETSLKLLENEDKAVLWQDTISSLANTAPVARQWSWVTPLALEVPLWIVNGINPKLGRIVGLHRVRPQHLWPHACGHRTGAGVTDTCG